MQNLHMTMISAPLTQRIPNKIMNFPLNHNKSFNRILFQEHSNPGKFQIFIL